MKGKFADLTRNVMDDSWPVTWHESCAILCLPRETFFYCQHAPRPIDVSKCLFTLRDPGFPQGECEGELRMTDPSLRIANANT